MFFSFNNLPLYAVNLILHFLSVAVRCIYKRGVMLGLGFVLVVLSLVLRGYFCFHFLPCMWFVV